MLLLLGQVTSMCIPHRNQLIWLASDPHLIELFLRSLDPLALLIVLLSGLSVQLVQLSYGSSLVVHSDQNLTVVFPQGPKLLTEVHISLTQATVSQLVDPKFLSLSDDLLLDRLLLAFHLSLL